VILNTRANFRDPPRIYALCNSAVNIIFCVLPRRGLWRKRQSRIIIDQD